MVQVIHTAVPGRARFKVQGLYHSQALKRRLETRLVEKIGIHEVSANPLTGNALISFNSEQTPSSIATLIEGIITAPETSNGHHSYDVATPAPHTATNGASPKVAAKVVAPIHAKDAPRGASTTDRTFPFLPSAPVSPATLLPARQGVDQTSPWHTLEASTALAALHSSATHGLSLEDARRHLQMYGPNALPESEPRSTWEMVTDQVNSLPVALLTVAAGISVVTGGLVDALVIMGVVAINATIGYVTENQSEATIRSLKNLVRPSAVIIRDQRASEISAAEVVPGDILVLKPGSYVAAD